MSRVFVTICLALVFLLSSTALGNSSYSTSNSTSTDAQLEYYVTIRDSLYPLVEHIYSTVAFSANNGLSKKQTYAEILTLLTCCIESEYSPEQTLISVTSYYQEFNRISYFMGYSINQNKDVDSVVQKIAKLALGFSKGTAIDVIKGSIKCSDYLAAFLYDAMRRFYKISTDFEMFSFVVNM